MSSFSVSAELAAMKQTFEAKHGPVGEDGCLPSGPMKFSGFPWFLVEWYESGGQTEQAGTCDDIGFHALFEVTDDDIKDFDVPSDVMGYIVREDSAGCMYYESFEDDDLLHQAWDGVVTDVAIFYECDGCNNTPEDCTCGDEDDEEQDEPPTGKCDQCDSATINGVYCHEHGCPNA